MSTRSLSIFSDCFNLSGVNWLLTTILSFGLVASSYVTSPLAAQEQPRQDIFASRSGIPAAVSVYKGRRVAMTMHYRGAEWLIRNEREREERCSLMLANLGIKPGMTVCDMGCGNGFYALQLAKMVGPKGQVLGVDIQPEMLKFLRDRMEQKNINNITPILGSLHDPRLPKGQVDLVLLVDVYHEFSHPEQMLKSIRDSLKPTGVVALLEYRSEDPKVPIKLLHKMSKNQILKEFPPNGFKLVREYDKLPWQHMMFFGRDETYQPTP